MLSEYLHEIGQTRYQIHAKGAYLLFLRCSGMCTPCVPINGSMGCRMCQKRIYQTFYHAWATRVARLRNRQAITVFKVLSGRQTSIWGDLEGVRSF